MPLQKSSPEEPFLLPPKTSTAQEKQALAAKVLSREGVEHHLVKVREETTTSCKPREELLLQLWDSRLVQAVSCSFSPSVCMGETGASRRAGGTQEGMQFLVALLFLAFSCPSWSEQGSWDTYADEQLSFAHLSHRHRPLCHSWAESFVKGPGEDFRCPRLHVFGPRIAEEVLFYETLKAHKPSFIES